ncbi:MAG: radical SAM/SPASM domain-containing protein [bacterium]
MRKSVIVEVDKNNPTSYLRSIVGEIRRTSTDDIILGLLPECNFDVVGERLRDLVDSGIRLIPMKNILEGLKRTRDLYSPDIILRMRMSGCPISSKTIDKLLESHVKSGADYSYTDGKDLCISLIYEAVNVGQLDKILGSEVPLLPDGTLNCFEDFKFNTYFLDFEDQKFYYGEHFEEFYSYPLGFSIEISSVCNLHCTMCIYQDYLKKNNILKFMPLNTFKKVIDEISHIGIKTTFGSLGSSAGKPCVELILRGEPLLYPQMEEILSYVKEKGVISSIVTNGLLLNNRMAELLLDMEVGSVVFSIDGATKETYERIRRGGNYDKVIQNVLNFIELREKKGAKVAIGTKMVIQEEAEEEIDEYVRWWIDRVDGVYAQCKYSVDPRNNDVIVVPKPLFWPKERVVCHGLFRDFIITTQGNVLMCGCQFREDKETMGNVNRSMIHDIWHSDKYSRYRESYLNKRIYEIPLCSKCRSVGNSFLTVKKRLYRDNILETTSLTVLTYTKY